MKDFYSDSGALLTKLFAGGQQLPDFVKQAEFIVEAGDLAGMSSNAFADPQGRQFPTYDKAATFVSMAYYLAGGEEDEQIGGRLKRACQLFSLDSEVKRLADVIAERKLAEGRKKEAAATEASTNESWSIDFESSTRSLKRAGVGKEAFLALCDNFLKIRPATEKVASLREAAREFVHEAQRLGGDFYADLPDDMFKLAGYGYPDADLFRAYASARAMALPDEYSKRNFVAKIAEFKGAEKDLEGLDKIADFLEQFDQTYNLGRLYGTKFPDPLRTVHNVSVRKAAQLTAKVAIGGTTYYAGELGEGAQKVALYVLGDEAYQERFSGGFDPKKLAQLEDSLAASFNQIFRPGVPEPLRMA
jgi:hypothetical protein